MAKDISDWHADRGDETLKLDFPLNASSVVFDVGAYTGLWSEAMSKRYSCRIQAFEPVRRFYLAAAKRLGSHPNVQVHNFGLWTSRRTMEVGISEDSSGLFSDAPKEMCQFDNISQWVRFFGKVDVIGMNCEGSEYALLDHLARSGEIARVRFLLVQFHDIRQLEPAGLYKDICFGLAGTHDLKWRYPFIWECWEKKGAPDVSPVPALQAGVPKAGPDAGLDDRDRDPSPDGM
jgi:FkbM family methyltransferase